jgi:hypothetical protein
MTWLLYLLVVVGAGLMLWSYRTRSSISSLTVDEVNALTRTMGTDFGVYLMASIALLTVLPLVLKSRPPAARYKSLHAEHAVTMHHELGLQLGKRLARKAPADSMALVITRKRLSPAGDREAGPDCNQAMLDGLKEGFGNRITVKHHAELEADTELSEAERCDPLVVSNRQLRGLRADHSECNVIVSFVDLAPDYGNSGTASTVSSRSDSLLGLYCLDPYMHLQAIARGAISACIVPRRGYDTQQRVANGLGREELFKTRLWMVTSETSPQELKQNQKLFHYKVPLD